MIKAGIVGGTGYTGVELLRLLARHPQVELTVITSRADAGTRVDSMFPNLRGLVSLMFTVPDIEALKQCDVVFFATPNGTAMSMVPAIVAGDTRVVDLAADFRLNTSQLWEKWYRMPHACPELLAEAVYGLPEVNRERIRTARLVANPGCYPTATQLGFLPLVERDWVYPDSLIADAKSGVSGAGRKAEIGSLYCEASDSLRAYGIEGHRHVPEIVQGLSACSPGSEIRIVFVPHLTPMIRGIHATLYAELRDHKADSLQFLYEERFRTEPFVDVMPPGSHPDTRSVRASNVCRIAVHGFPETNRVVIVSVIDNLVKGAAGQAVQNMNIMFGLLETAGLEHIAVLP